MKKDFKKFVPGVDNKAQFENKLDEIEELIFKPYKKRGEISLTEEELEKYINLDEEEIRSKYNIKTTLIFESTKDFLIKNKEKILKQIKKEEKENDNER